MPWSQPLMLVTRINWFGAILTAMNLNQYSIAAAQPGLAVERILNLYLPVPHPQEQKDIATTLEGATADIDAAVAAHAGRWSWCRSIAPGSSPTW